jgi:Ca2+-binding EF-hand superfamily protein
MEEKMNDKFSKIIDKAAKKIPLNNNGYIQRKEFVVYSYDKNLTAEDINKILKEHNVTTRELTDDEVIYQI